MKSYLFHAASFLLLVLVLCPWSSTAFVVNKAAPSVLSTSTTGLYGAVELVPEPEGGEELTAIKTLDGSRMKNMGEAEGVTSEDGSTVYKFWLKAKVEGTLIKELHSEVLKQSAKKANFPGFRKGQVPPYAMPQIRGFSVQEGIIKTCQSAVDAYGLKSIKGSDGEVEVLEDIPEVAADYKLGDSVEFTATFKAIFDPEVSRPGSADDSTTPDDVIDVEAEETSATAAATE
jgi:hypothetical protein